MNLRCRLLRQKYPDVSLNATGGLTVGYAQIATHPTVLFCYPKTGPPGGIVIRRDPAHSCTAQALAYKACYHAFCQLGTRVFGLSTQTTTYQDEAVSRLGLPFALLSDADLLLTSALQLPTRTVDGTVLLERLTLVIIAGRIAEVFYPIEDARQDAQNVEGWLRSIASQ